MIDRFVSKEAEYAYAQTLNALHDAIVMYPGGSRWNTRDKAIQPLGTRLAGDAISQGHDYVRKLLNPEHLKHEVNLRHIINWLSIDVDTSFLDELESLAGRVAFSIEPCHESTDLATEAVHLGKEIGDVFHVMQRAFADKSDGGIKPTRKESRELHREGREAISGILKLMHSFDQLVENSEGGS